MSEAKTSGLYRERLLHLKSVVQEDIARGRYLGGVLIVARHGEIGLHEALGHADEGRTRAVQKDSVFSIFSVTKAFTNVLVMQAIEQGRLALTTPISSVIPEFSGRGREAVTLFHLLTHTSGFPSLYTPRDGMCIDRLSEVIEAICQNVYPAEAPGTRVDYSPMINHALMGEAVRRTDPRKRRYRQILEEEIFKPLAMRDSSVGLRRDLRERHLVPEFRGNAPMNHLGHSNLGPQGAFLEEEAEMPWVGVSSTASDMFRFAEALRRGGELDGARILGPTILERARQCWTGDKPNEVYKRLAESRGWRVMPAYIGLGFSLRGTEIGPTLFGTLTSPHTFGNYGAGTTLFWVDPALDMTFVGLMTGVLTSGDNIERWQRLSDIAVSAAI
ncbi:MAG TPA: serine hydrolase domain-containing protein [Steroidobacteraceae bacterium]|nr:serine hydrolase domain-containing protein [Steroidobacteraceae bacterium]